MPITHDYLDGDHILVTVATGEVGEQDISQSNRHVWSIAEANPGVKILIDTCAARVVTTPAQLLALLDNFYQLLGPIVPVALVVPPRPENPNPMLAETQAYINGAQMRVFHQRDEGFAWLRSLQPGKPGRPDDQD